MKYKPVASPAFPSPLSRWAANMEEKSAAKQLDDVKTETKATAQEMKDFTFAQKAEFVGPCKFNWTRLTRIWTNSPPGSTSSTDAVKADAKPKLQALRDQVTKLNHQLDEARNASESTWDSVKADSQLALNSVKNTFQQSRQWLSDKIAP